MKIRKFLIFASMALGLIYSSLLQADEFIPEYNILKGTLSIPQILLSDGRLLGPFELMLNADEEFKISDSSNVVLLPPTQLDNATPTINADFSKINFPLVRVNLAGVVYSVTAILESQAGRFCFKLKSFKALSATIPVSGSGTSNNGGGEYMVVDGSTITISPQKVDWDLAIRIQNLSGHNQGSVHVSIPANSLGEYQFSESGIAGTFNAFEDVGQIEEANDVRAMVTFDENDSPDGMILKGKHTHDQNFQFNVTVNRGITLAIGFEF